MPEVLMVGTTDVYTENEQPVDTSTSGVAWPDAMAGSRPGWLPHRPTADQVGWSAHS